MSAATTTRRQLPSESPDVALARIQSGFSANDAAVVEQFAAAGIDPAEIDPRNNVLTFNAWKAVGRRVAAGATAVRVTTWIPCSEPDERGNCRRRPKTAFLFHVSQTVPRDSVKGARPAAWQNPQLVKPGTYAPAPGAHVDPPRELPADRSQPPQQPAPAIVDELAAALADQTPARFPRMLQTAAQELGDELRTIADELPAEPADELPRRTGGRIEYEARLWFGANSRTNCQRHTGETEAEALAKCEAELERHRSRFRAKSISVTRWTVAPDGGRNCLPFSGDMYSRTFAEAAEILAAARKELAAEQQADELRAGELRAEIVADGRPAIDPAPIDELPQLPADLAGLLFAK